MGRAAAGRLQGEVAALDRTELVVAGDLDGAARGGTRSFADGIGQSRRGERRGARRGREAGGRDRRLPASLHARGSDVGLRAIRPERRGRASERVQSRSEFVTSRLAGGGGSICERRGKTWII